MNSSWTERFACLRQTASSCFQSAKLWHDLGHNAYRRYSQKHDDQLLLVEYWMPYKSICESR